jgi:cysteinyl-tRNA synthetase
MHVVLQALDKAAKDLDKARKVREPLTKKLAEDPAALDTLAAEVTALQQQLAAL